MSKQFYHNFVFICFRKLIDKTFRVNLSLTLLVRSKVMSPGHSNGFASSCETHSFIIVFSSENDRFAQNEQIVTLIKFIFVEIFLLNYYGNVNRYYLFEIFFLDIHRGIAYSITIIVII